MTLLPRCHGNILHEYVKINNWDVPAMANNIKYKKWFGYYIDQSESIQYGVYWLYSTFIRSIGVFSNKGTPKGLTEHNTGIIMSTDSDASIAWRPLGCSKSLSQATVFILPTLKFHGYKLQKCCFKRRPIAEVSHWHSRYHNRWRGLVS